MPKAPRSPSESTESLTHARFNRRRPIITRTLPVSFSVKKTFFVLLTHAMSTGKASPLLYLCTRVPRGSDCAGAARETTRSATIATRAIHAMILVLIRPIVTRGRGYFEATSTAAIMTGEACPSGRRERTANALRGDELLPGFKSLRLRAGRARSCGRANRLITLEFVHHTRARSSVDQSVRLRTGRSGVRIPPGVPKQFLLQPARNSQITQASDAKPAGRSTTTSRAGLFGLAGRL